MEKETHSIEELKTIYNRFYKEVLYSYSGTKLDEIKDAIQRFETNVAPAIDLFPNDTKYWIEKTAIPAGYVGADIEKNTEARDRFRNGLLTMCGFNDNEIAIISERINKKRKREDIAFILMRKRFEERAKRS